MLRYFGGVSLLILDSLVGSPWCFQPAKNHHRNVWIWIWFNWIMICTYTNNTTHQTKQMCVCVCVCVWVWVCVCEAGFAIFKLLPKWEFSILEVFVWWQQKSVLMNINLFKPFMLYLMEILLFVSVAKFSGVLQGVQDRAQLQTRASRRKSSWKAD